MSEVSAERDAEMPAAHRLCEEYLSKIHGLMTKVLVDERQALDRAADRIATQIESDRLVHVYGPGGHSNLAAQDVFFRAGGLTHMSAILDEGTLLSNGALRSLSMERTPGYGRLVIADQRLGETDLLLLVSAYGVNAALIDAAAEARARGVFLIGLNSHAHAGQCPADHPARHESRRNLQDVVDIAIDTKMPPGDALLEIDGVTERIGASSSYVNLFSLHCLMIQATAKLAQRGSNPPIWRSANAAGGDEANRGYVERFKGRVRWL